MEKLVNQFKSLNIVLLLLIFFGFSSTKTMFFRHETGEEGKRQRVFDLLKISNRAIKIFDLEVGEDFENKDRLFEDATTSEPIEYLCEEVKKRIELRKGHVQVAEAQSLVDFETTSSDEESKRDLLRKKGKTCKLAWQMLRASGNDLDMLLKESIPEPLRDVSKLVNVSIFLNWAENPITRARNYKPDVFGLQFTRALREGFDVAIVASPIIRDVFDFYNRYEGEIDGLRAPGSYCREHWREFVLFLRGKLAEGLLKLYVTKEFTLIPFLKEEYVVIVSTESGDKRSLKELGLNPDYLKPIQVEDIERETSHRASRGHCVDQLKKIFYKPSPSLGAADEDEEGEGDEVSIVPEDPIPGKLIYMGGHGGHATGLEDLDEDSIILTAGTYMGINHANFLDFLDFLNGINTQGLLINTCHSGGWNSLKMLHKSVSFPIIVSAISDNCSFTSYTLAGSFKTFYEDLGSLITKKIPFSDWLENEDFKKGLRAVLIGGVSNIPSVCLPGRMFFEVVNIRDDVRIVSPDETEPIRLRDENALILTGNIVNAHLTGNIPLILSLVPGRTHSYLRSMRTDLGLDDLIKRILGDVKVVSPEMFFIGDLRCGGRPALTYSWIGDLHINDFYYVRRYEKRAYRDEVMHITGGGLLRGSSYIFFKKDIWFKFEYDTISDDVRVTEINKLEYTRDFIHSLACTIPTKEAMFTANPEGHRLLLDIGKRVFYDVDHEFLCKANKWFENIDLEHYILDEDKFHTIDRDGLDSTEVETDDAALEREIDDPEIDRRARNKKIVGGLAATDLLFIILTILLL